MENGDHMAAIEFLLDVLSRELRPTVVVFEDTQWADEATTRHHQIRGIVANGKRQSRRILSVER